MTINWTDPTARVTANFTVKEACWLPTWGKLHNPTKREQEALQQTCALMEKIRTVLGRPISVHCMIRPTEYNKLIGGAKQSPHIKGLACDFSVEGLSCDDVRTWLLPFLDFWKARMEDKPGSNWVHVDLINTSGQRFFTP